MMFMPFDVHKGRGGGANDGWGREAMTMGKFVSRAAALLCLLAPVAGLAQDGGRNQPGQFDFYVLSLSWSPSFCAEAAERHHDRSAGRQCGARPFSFVVHGLWPQYEKGFPENCQEPAPWLEPGIIRSMLPLMPAPHLIINEWRKHGTCSGLLPQAFFDTVTKAKAAVKIPPEYGGLDKPLDVAPGAVADAFVKANPGLSPAGIAIECDNRRLTEVRICLSKDLKFRECADVAKRSCRRDHVVMPPVRGRYMMGI
jgi:ribonuclease T2